MDPSRGSGRGIGRGRGRGRVSPIPNFFEEEFHYEEEPVPPIEPEVVEFLSLTQGNRSIREYEAQLWYLYRYVQEWNARPLAQKFMQGLRPEIRSLVMAQGVTTWSDIFSTAMAVEQEAQIHQSEISAFRDSRGKGKAVSGDGDTSDRRSGVWKKQKVDHRGPARVDPSGADTVGRTEPVTCFNCGEAGHYSRACPKIKDGRCFKCRQPGHFAKDCPMGQEVRRASPPLMTPAATCYRCGEMGHMVNACPRPGGLICYRCKQPGHFSRDCPQRRMEGQDYSSLLISYGDNSN